MLGISWRSAQVVWRLGSASDYNHVSDELHAIHTPLLINESTTFEKRIEPALATPKAKEAHSVRAALLTILLYGEKLP